MSEKDMGFEQAIEKLEEIVKQLEEGGLSLDKSLETYTEGVRLIKFCNKELNKAEKKIEIVLNEDEGYTDVVPYEQGEELN